MSGFYQYSQWRELTVKTVQNGTHRQDSCQQWGLEGGGTREKSWAALWHADRQKNEQDQRHED
jgi:hypothetical protein